MIGSGSGLVDFSERTVILTGAASGMGAAVLDLLLAAGAEVHAVDVAPVDVTAVDSAAGDPIGRLTSHRCDIGDRAAVDDLLAALPGDVDALLNCAGVPNGGRYSGRQVMEINWLGLRHLTESVVDRMKPGSAVVHVASTAGRAWAERRAELDELMAADSWDRGLDWLDRHPEVYGDGYVFSKEAVQYYTLWRSVQLLPSGIRMNSICPGVTDTAIIGDFRRGMGDDLVDHATAVAGRMAQPGEMAPAMLFLADERSSSYINGVNLNIDRGTAAARASAQDDPRTIWGR